jgi:adenylate cyclase class 1
VNSQAPRAIKLGRPGEDIGRKDLAAVVRRFQNLHRLQLQRIQEYLTPRQAEFTELLPLLFHCNHPHLPGFVSSETPFGIPDFHPGARALECARRLSKTFEYKKRALPEYPIQALYLMGSVGSIAYSKRSDLDLWLCHKGDLEKSALDELRRKAAAVEQWAGSLGLETHIFFIDTDRFRLGYGTPISTESCGNVQHYLLLEEFYRTSLWLAGRIPAWWLVPPEQEDQYTEYLHHLRDKRFVNEQDLIDFGGLEHVRPDEFLGGALWHLHKAIDAPHKSLLKLFLMESYAAEYPRIQWLCTRLKTAVFAGSVEVNELDSYILMYRKVEQFFLERGETDRLELARQSFYLKINELLTVQSGAGTEKRHRREVLETMIGTWNWQPHRIRELDDRRRWTLTKALGEQKVIGRELTESYKAIRRFALEHAEIDRPAGEEVKLLGRRLAAALERKPGKVEKLNLDSGDRIEPGDFSLLEIRLADGEPGWALYSGRIPLANAASQQAIKKARSLIEILAWLCLNGLYRRNITVIPETVESALTLPELRSTLDALAGFLEARHHEPDSLGDYGHASYIKAAALFVNLGIDADAGRRDGSRLASNRSDALSYGYERANLVYRVDALFVTSWREILVNQFQGLAGVFDCFADLINESFSDSSIVECFCFAPGRARTIVLRLNQLYQDLSATFRGGNGSQPCEYVIRGGREFYLFERRQTGVRFRSIAEEDRLYAELAAPRPIFSPLIFDRFALDDDLLPSIYHRNRAGVIQVFCLPEPGRMRVFILDERGSLYHRIHEPLGPQLVLGPYALFIGAILQRYILAAGGIEYYLVESLRGGGYGVRPAGFQPYPVGKVLEIRVFAQEVPTGAAAYTIVCNDQEFSSMESGQDVFAQAVAYILHLRRSGENYPIYITDIDVPLAILGVDTPDQLQTIHFLNYKLKIEQRLNQ